MHSAHFGMFNAQSLCLIVDAFARPALVVDDVIERTLTIKQDAHQPTFFPIGIFDTVSAIDGLSIFTDLAYVLRERAGDRKVLGAVAIGILKLEGEMFSWVMRSFAGTQDDKVADEQFGK